MAKAILDGLRARILASTNLLAAVGNRIYLDEAPANAALPLVVYSATSSTVTPHFGGQNRYDIEMDFLIAYNNAGNQAIHTVAQEIEAMLATKFAATGFTAVTAIKVLGGVPAFEDDAWTMTERYRLTAWDI